MSHGQSDPAVLTLTDLYNIYEMSPHPDFLAMLAEADTALHPTDFHAIRHVNPIGFQVGKN